MEHIYEVEIAEYNSSEIRSHAAEIGATHMRKITAGVLNGASATLFAMKPQDGVEIRVLDTNADPVWEEDNHTVFAETLQEYGINEME